MSAELLDAWHSGDMNRRERAIYALAQGPQTVAVAHFLAVWDSQPSQGEIENALAGIAAELDGQTLATGHDLVRGRYIETVSEGESDEQ